MSDNITANDFLETDLGNISPNPRGGYDDTATYEYLDLVEYEGGSYLCTAQIAITGVSPQSGQTTEHWQLLTAPGNLTPEYIAMHDRVELDAQQVAIDRAAVELSHQEVSLMKDGITVLHNEVLENSELVEQNKDSAMGYAQAADVSRQAAEDARTDVSALVNGFDGHVATKTTEATGAITTERQAAVDVVQQQGTTSAQKVVTDTDAFITQKTDAAKTEIENTRDGVIQSVNMAGETQTGNINTAGAAQVQAVQTAGASYQAQITKNTISIGDLQAYLGYADDDILGLQVDYKNKTFTRIAGAVGLNAGADFDKFSMFGGRKRCNVNDSGTITAWFGESAFKEDGSNGQVMVYQPKFYYLVCPVVYDPIDTGIGYHLRKANYYVSEKARAGFRLHPAFYDANGNEIDYILLPAFEGSLFDTSENAYLMNDEQAMNASEDLMCSIAGVKPASGLAQNLTRPDVEQMAKNRGAGWHSYNIKAVSANQMLMLVELGMFNTQTGITNGVVSTSNNSAYNCSSLTGSTSELGNASGKASQTINEKGGVTTTETANGKTSVSYRGMENPWGNIWDFVYGINIWGNAQMDGGEPYICSDFNFVESKHNDNYEGAGFYLTNANGFVSAFGYSQKYDWLFLPSEALGNSSLPVGDQAYVTSNLNGYRIALLGGAWDGGAVAGGFCWSLYIGVGSRTRTVGGRLVYVPTATL